MRLGRGNRDHPVAAADAATAVVEDTVAVAKEAASEGATRDSQARQSLRVVGDVAVLRDDCAQDASTQRGGYIASTF